MNTENINIEDIKVGETYNVQVKVLSVENGNRIITRTVGEKNKELSLCATNFFKEELPAFSHVSPAPKYDPCRMFKDGDIVTPQEVNGRIFSGAVEELIGQNCVVVEDELECCNVRIRHGEDEYTIDPAYLELVTPVEELEPYIVVPRQEIDEPDNYLPYYAVVSCGCEVARFYVEQYIAGQAKAAAEAECARLNAEYRKEQE